MKEELWIVGQAKSIDGKQWEFQGVFDSHRAALFQDCGLGKTIEQLEWAKLVSERMHGPILIVAPLAVSGQTAREGKRFGYDVTICRSGSDITDGINITNYEMLHRFDADAFCGLVLDESSILKAYDGVTRKAITAFAELIPYRLACTATPAPNDYTELCNHAEFLGVMTEAEVKAMFFVQDGNTTTAWRLKRHAISVFWKWVATWALAARMPSDLGFENDGFILPALNIHEVEVGSDWKPDGHLFPGAAITLHEQRQARRESITERVRAIADMVNDTNESWVVWCELNDESQALKMAIADSVEVKGSDSIESKESALMRFTSGDARVIVTKPKIAGFGMNWQHCQNMAFVGISHSYEQFYQAIRRIWRFGQTSNVNIYVVTDQATRQILANVKDKESKSADMMDGIIRNINSEMFKSTRRDEAEYVTEKESGNGWQMWRGDSCDLVHTLEDGSVGLSVFSPPFPGMYVYSNSERDLGNSNDMATLVSHFQFIMSGMLPKMMAGRTCAIHLTQYVAQKRRDGFIGLRDFRGEVINMMSDIGWIFYGEAVIDKNPQVKAIRTKDRGLLFKTLASDSANLHMALPDYLLQFRAPGDNPQPIKAGISDRYGNPDGWITSEEWIRWARPVWYADDWAPNGDGISETDVLNVRAARDERDERHLAPLQLGLITRAVKLWSAPGDLVFSPFAGIASEGVVSIKNGRRFIGIELKESYWKQGCKYLRETELSNNQLALV